MNVEFALRKSRIKTNLKQFQQYFPDKPENEYIDDAMAKLHQLGKLLLIYYFNHCFYGL